MGAGPRYGGGVTGIAERRLILVCEDHPIARRVMERQLRVLGYTAEMYDNGLSGLTAWRSGRFGLVLTDLYMPEMDGLALARHIRAEELRDALLGRTPIIALSGDSVDEQRAACVGAGMDDFLAKPTLLKDLESALRVWLSAPLDQEALSQSLGDDPVVLHQMLGEFLEADSDDLSALRAAVEARDCARIVRSAHRMEGAARLLGAMPYARAAERVKRLFALEQDAAERSDALDLLKQEGERLRTWLRTTRHESSRAVDGQAH